MASKFKSCFRKFKAWCKRNWKFLLGVSIPVIVMLVTGKSNALKDLLARTKIDYEKEIDVINKSHEKEIEDRELAEKRYRDSIKRIEEEHLKAEEELDKSKKKEIKKIISENGSDPDEITRRISEITGFDIHIQ